MVVRERAVDGGQRYIDALRQALFAPDDFTDEEVLKATDGTFLAARVRLRLALDDFYDALYKVFGITGHTTNSKSERGDE